MVLPSLLMRTRMFLRAIKKRMGLGNSLLRWSSGIAASHVPWCAGEERLRARESVLLHALWFQVKDDLGPGAIEQEDILHFALEELNIKLAGAEKEDALLRLLFKVCDTFDV
jgi:hypothetical protein